MPHKLGSSLISRKILRDVAALVVTAVLSIIFDPDSSKKR